MPGTDTNHKPSGIVSCLGEAEKLQTPIFARNTVRLAATGTDTSCECFPVL